MENESYSTFSLLQPELLTEEQLREILISRCVTRNLAACSKDELVELFRSVALPLPQREYGDSRRERLLSKKQQKRRKISISDDDKTNSKRRISFSTTDTTSNAMSSSSLLKLEAGKRPDRVSEQASADRLKPPVDLINFKRKVIRLSDSAKQRITSELDKIVIKNKQAKEKTNIALVKESTDNAKRVCIGTEMNGSKQDIGYKNNNIATSAAIKLKRNSLEPNEGQSSVESNKNEEKPPQKKRQKIVITW